MNIGIPFVFIVISSNVFGLQVGSKTTLTLFKDDYQSIPVYFNSYYKDFNYVTMQSHSQYENNTISFVSSSAYGQSYESKNSGIVKKLNSYSNEFTVYAANTGYGYNYYINALMLAVPIKDQHPIPGGCCLTCNLENDPNIKITYTDLKTSISFSRASKYYYSDAPDCDNSENPATYDLTYKVFYMYMNENDYKEGTLFEALFKMSTPELIKSNGILLTTLKKSSELSVDIETVSAQGVVFNVIVTDTSNWLETAYVPSTVYACNFTVPDDASDSCYAKASTTVLVFTILFALVGVVVCFAGFKLFRLFVLLCGIVLYWFIVFIVLSRYTNSNQVSQHENVIISFMISLIGGGLTLLMFGFDKLFYLMFLKICLVFGMFLSAIIFYTPFGYFDVWNEDYHFILGFASIALVFAMICLFAPKAAVYMSSSLMGSFAMIMVPNYFLRSNMQYIVMTVVNRLVVPKFGYLYLRRPYAHLEYILTGAWAGGFVLGVLIQYATTKNQEFHYSGKQLRHKVWSRISQSVNLGRSNREDRLRRPVPARQYQPSPPPVEATPLLNNLEESQEELVGSYGGLGRTNPNFNTSQQASAPVNEDALIEHQPLIHQANENSNFASNEPPPPYEHNNQNIPQQNVPHRDVQPPAYEENERQPLLQNQSPTLVYTERYPARIV